MIKNVIDLLDYAQGETENIRIAQGKYYLGEGFKKMYKQYKKEFEWQRR
jgi:hypothetical protein